MTKRQDRTYLRLSPLQIVDLLPGERWAAVAGFDGYFVSTCGRVCSTDRIIDGKIKRGVLLKAGTYSSGHRYVCLGRGNHSQVHTLVLQAFVGPAPQACEGLHFDDNPANNNLFNLRWGTRSANLHDAVRNGKKAIGEDISQAKLTDDAVRFIRANPKASLTSLGNQFGVSAAAIKQVRNGITWKHVA
jgi:hypothetical protein